MITKELFIRCLKNLKAYSEKEQVMYDSSDGVLNLIEFKELQDTITSFIDLLAYCLKCEEIPQVGTDLDYFIYDMEFGKNFDKYHIQRSDEDKPVPMRTIEEAWDYFVSEHPEIVDEEDSK